MVVKYNNYCLWTLDSPLRIEYISWLGLDWSGNTSPSKGIISIKVIRGQEMDSFAPILFLANIYAMLYSIDNFNKIENAKVEVRCISLSGYTYVFNPQVDFPVHINKVQESCGIKDNIQERSFIELVYFMKSYGICKFVIIVKNNQT